jgi:16S rRNA processing protein RimM
MKYIYIGKIVNTHALKGEVRIISNFEYKDRVFNISNKLYIGKDKCEEVIETYRKHKNYDMVKFKNIDNINDVLKYKGMNVYFDENELKLSDDEILIEELPLYSIYSNDKLIGKIEEYRSDNGNNMVRVNNKLIPYNNSFITKIDKNKKIIYMHDIEVFL